MSRYVDADALIQELKRQYMFLFGTEEIPNGIGMLIENFPTADVVPTEFHDKCMQIEIEKRRNMVEVVRCKDCKFRKIEFGWNGKKYKMCANTDYPTDDDAYCSYAERREDAEIH